MKPKQLIAAALLVSLTANFTAPQTWADERSLNDASRLGDEIYAYEKNYSSLQAHTANITPNAGQSPSEWEHRWNEFRNYLDDFAKTNEQLSNLARRI